MYNVGIYEISIHFSKEVMLKTSLKGLPTYNLLIISFA